jgi:hypothetical protein
MCDYSLQNVKSRPAAVGDKLITKNFGTGSRGFAAPSDPGTAVCVLPGTELAFDAPVKFTAIVDGAFGTLEAAPIAIFRQVRKDEPRAHHDTLEFPDGAQVLLTHLAEGQMATVLQLPAAPKTKAEAEAQERVPISA